MNNLTRILRISVPAAFTIEASVILPIVFIITAWFITTSFTIHDRIRTFSSEIFTTIKNAPVSDTVSASEHISIDGLNGRKVLLKYRLLAEGLKTLSGGMELED